MYLFIRLLSFLFVFFLFFSSRAVSTKILTQHGVIFIGNHRESNSVIVVVLRVSEGGPLTSLLRIYLDFPLQNSMDAALMAPAALPNETNNASSTKSNEPKEEETCRNVKEGLSAYHQKASTLFIFTLLNSTPQVKSK